MYIEEREKVVWLNRMYEERGGEGERIRVCVV